MQLETLIIPIKTTFDKGALLGAATAITALVGLATAAVKATMDWADEMDALGDITGMTNKDLAAYAFIARKSGVGTDTLTKGMTILNKGLVEVNGSLGTTGKALKNYGIEVKDSNGVVKDQSTLLADISSKYNEFSTQQEKVNFLTEVFGKSGADLVDLFDTLASDGGIDEVAKKVSAFGLAIDPARYEQFARNIEEIKLAGLGLAVSFTEWLMPALEGITDWVMQFQGMTPDEIFQKILDDVNNFDFATIGEAINKGFGKIDWKAVGQGFMDTLITMGGGFAEFMAGLTGQNSLENVIQTWSDNIILFLAIMVKLGVIAIKVIDSIKSTWLAGWGIIKNYVITQVNAIIKAINSVPLLPNFSYISAGGKTPRSGRASGGPVIEGQSYNVTEFYKPEVFSPGSSGRIDAKGNVDNITAMLAALIEKTPSRQELARIYRDTQLLAGG